MQHSTQTDHPTLQSETKYSYLFPKTRRFVSKNPECPEAFYTFDSQLSLRKTTMGFGKRSDFTKTKTQSPPPTHYALQAYLQQKHKGKTFGCARQKSPDRSYLIPQIHQNPGPAQYENTIETRMPQKYSIGSKTLDLVEKHSNRYTPAPNSYQSIDLQSHRQQLIKYKHIKHGKIQPNINRFPEIRLTPGPSSYQHHDGSGEEGYKLSQHRAKGARVFTRQARFTSSHWKTSDSPAPNNYTVPTEFGRTNYGHKLNKTIQY